MYSLTILYEMMDSEMKIFILFVIIVSTCLAQRKAKDMCSDFVNYNLSTENQLTHDNHISNGVRTKDNEFSHMVALGFGSLRRPLWLCGGTLISNQFVLTAAHCTSLAQIGFVRVVRLGTRILTPSRTQNYKEVKVAQIFRHPNYKPPLSYNDIALLKLQKTVQFSVNILPACLNSANNVNIAAKTLLALGWGKTDFAGNTSDDLMKVGLRVVRNRECNRSYRGAPRNKLPDGVRDETQLCAGGDFQQDTCQGDSGGPLQYKNGKFNYIIGITSFGKACGISRTPGVYTRVSAFVPWIESIVWP